MIYSEQRNLTFTEKKIAQEEQKCWWINVTILGLDLEDLGIWWWHSGRKGVSVIIFYYVPEALCSESLAFKISFLLPLFSVIPHKRKEILADIPQDSKPSLACVKASTLHWALLSSWSLLLLLLLATWPQSLQAYSLKGRNNQTISSRKTHQKMFPNLLSPKPT